MKKEAVIRFVICSALSIVLCLGVLHCGGSGKGHNKPKTATTTGTETATGTSTSTDTGSGTGTGTASGIGTGTAYIVIDLSTGGETGHETLSDLETNDAYKTTHMVLKYIPAGSFNMGDQVGEGDSDELPVHTVDITEGFYMGVFEVTQRQWYIIRGDWPSSFTTDPDKRPVERVSWNDINESGGFLDTLSTLTSETYRLPTEVEWEYCCKAGTSTSYSYGSSADGAYMWYYHQMFFRRY